MSMNKSKKIISVIAAAALSFSALSLAACADKDYKGEALTAGYQSDATVASNGGFLVEKGNYVYFINGQESNTADNTYGDVVKGALMRLSKTELAAGNYSKAQIVVPSLFVTGSYASGIYIYGDYVYYATPTADNDNQGNVANSSLDFKRAKLDGSEAPMGGKNNYFFRLTDNSVTYRYVQVGGTVYCMYEESGVLKSYNVTSGETVVLVSGADSFYYDTEDLSNPNVYYTMSVSNGLDEENSTTKSYNQIYCVNAANTAVVTAAKASYAVKNAAGATIAEYDFDEAFLKKQAEEASSSGDDEYDPDDYTTYPYVNLGELVLDGIGAEDTFPEYRKHGVTTPASQASEKWGYVYTIQGQKNGGLYFTRSAAKAITSNNPEYLYYLPSSRVAEWNTITSNQTLTLVAYDTAAASSTAIYLSDHSYLYLDGSNLKRGKLGEASIRMESGLDSVTLWKVDGEYLYYYGTGTNGKNLSRIKLSDDAGNYEFMGGNEYDPVTVPLVDWTDAWYKPEFVTVGETTFVFYANAQSFGSGATAYNNIYVTKLGTNEQLTARQETLDAIEEYIDGYSDNSQAQAVMRYYFRTAQTSAYDAVKDLYSEKQQEYVTEFVKKFTDENGEFKGAYEKDFIALVGRVNESDQEGIDAAWESSLLQEEEEEEEDDSLPTWAIVLIVCGSVLVVAAAVLIPLLIHFKRKKANKKREEAIVSAYRRKKIDTTDDKSIDVYKDDEDETPAESEASEPVTEAETTEETPAEEPAPAEETTESEASESVEQE